MTPRRTYSDAELVDAVAESSSWRGVLRALGLSATSAGAIRSVRSHSARLGIDHGHFGAQRRWTVDQLEPAITNAETWPEVLAQLSVPGSVRSISTVRGHAVRLGLNCSHLAEPPTRELPLSPDLTMLHRAGPLLAAAWYTLCGGDVSWPLEPARYDLLVGNLGELRRIQVKTTTVRAAATWKVYLSTSGSERRTYDVDEIDEFFVIDGDLTHYVIPYCAVGGLHAIHLAAYSQYQVASPDASQIHHKVTG